jgi:outer membrane murein-binding lipoprotein Lpp
VIGFLVVGLCVGAGAWCGLLDAGTNSQRIRELNAQVQQLENTHNKLKATLEAKQDAYDQRQAAFGARELLPESSPVEGELGAVSALGRQHRLELTGFTPAGSKQYPGIDEVRYKMSAKGRFASYLGFLEEFQGGDSWADVTYLSLKSGDAQAPAATTGELTISMYSATKEDAAEAATQ